MPRRNLPTTSDRRVTAQFGAVRANERDTLLSLVRLRPGMTVLDVQAAGGYLSDEVHRRLEGRVTCVCLEPSADLRAGLNPAFRAIDNPVEEFPDVADASIDLVLGLAGLHHSESHAATLRECHRVLRPGGELAMCDVEAGSHVATWLNDYVDRHNTAGHRGRFPAAGAMAAQLEALGFDRVRESARDVPWVFPDRRDIPVFFKALFGLTPALEEIDRAMDRYFSLQSTPHGIELGWTLLYASGRKPVSAAARAPSDGTPRSAAS